METEAITAADLLLRQALRKSVVAAAAALPQPPTLPFLPAPPNPLTLPAPFVIPPSGGRPARPLIVSTEELVENLAPKLTREEELYAISLTDLVKSTLGPDAAADTHPGIGAQNYGIKLSATFACLLLYLWTLVAPYALRDTRDFGIEFDD